MSCRFYHTFQLVKHIIVLLSHELKLTLHKVNVSRNKCARFESRLALF